jgi:hypothetical protein
MALYGAAARADWETIPDITLEAETNDNPTMNSGLGVAPTGIDEASRLLADVVLRFRNRQPRGELTLEPRVRRDAYADSEAQGFESTDVFFRSNGLHRGQTVQIGYAADVARERILGLEFLETLPTEAVGDDPSAITTTEIGANERRTRVGVSPYIDMALNSRSTLRLDGRLVDIDYANDTSTSRSDFLERAIGGEYQRNLDQRRIIGVRIFATGYEAAVNNNVTDTRGIELVYARDITELWRWSIAAGTQRSDFALSTGGRRVRGTDSTGTFGLTVSKRGERSRMRTELHRRMSPDSLGFVAPRDEIRVAFDRMLSPRINGGFGLRLIDAEGVPTVPDSGRRYGRAELDIEWQFGRQWSFVAGYAHAAARSDSSTGTDAQSNSLTVGVRYLGLAARRETFAQ